MILDESTISNLELVKNSYDKSPKKTLFSVLNRTKSAMGRRLLETYILQPLIDINEIQKRLDCVDYFYYNKELCDTVSDIISQINDLERLISRFSIGKVFPADFLNLASSLNQTHKIRNILNESINNPLYEIAQLIPDLLSLSDEIISLIKDEPANSPEQGRVVREGASDELDRLYSIKNDARSWIIEYQEEEKKRLDISTLKIKYNKVHGYYIEVSKSYTNRVDDSYLRKQTLVNAERYTTEKLQKFETEILSSSEKIIEIESKIIDELKQKVNDNCKEIQSASEKIAFIDCIASLSQTALSDNYIRPEILPDGITEVTAGRHPVVEKYFTKESFIPNDIYFDRDKQTLKIITGPNMSGKSTYMRMAAIIQLLAQMGSFVPAEKAVLAIADRIFTRIGASDNISRGESTFSCRDERDCTHFE
jgi:DNA mismatch repair protein MutS